MQALTRKFTLDGDVDMHTLAHQVPPQCTGADMYGVCADAWMHALRRTIALLTAQGRVVQGSDEAQDLDDVEVSVGLGDFETAMEKLVPSLTEPDLQRYDKLQEQYSSGGAGASAAAPQPARSAADDAPNGAAEPRRNGSGMTSCRILRSSTRRAAAGLAGGVGSLPARQKGAKKGRNGKANGMAAPVDTMQEDVGKDLLAQPDVEDFDAGLAAPAAWMPAGEAVLQNGSTPPRVEDQDALTFL